MRALCRIATRLHSKLEYRPPQTAKLPPSTGADRLMACAAGLRQRLQQQQLHDSCLACRPASGWAGHQCRARAGARTSTPPRRRAPEGEFLLPLIMCQRPPPTAPMPKAPPMSSRMRSGQGSLHATAGCLGLSQLAAAARTGWSRALGRQIPAHREALRGPRQGHPMA